MKKSLIAITLFVAAGAVLIPSCKKKTDDPTSTPKPVNVLCDGNGTTSYYPLVSSNTWTYNYTIGGIAQSTHPSLVVSGTSSHDSKNYFKITDGTSLMYVDDREYREDASTHNIYCYVDMEYLYVPAAPVLNQTWPYAYSRTRKVTNLNATVGTSSCSYTGLLEISEYDSGSTLKEKDYYKKGEGLIYVDKPSSFFEDKYTLTSVTLH